MKESVTYQAIVEEGVVKGRAEEARKLLIRLGTSAFGKPPARVRKTIENIVELVMLERLVDRLAEVETWDELLERV